MRHAMLALPLTMILLTAGAARTLPSQEGVRLRTVVPPERQGVITGFEPAKGLTLQSGQDEFEYPISEIISLSPPSPSSAIAKRPALVGLVGGDTLRGTLIGGNSEQIELELPVGGKLTIGIDFLTGFSLSDGENPPLPLSAYGDVPDEEDVLFRRTDAGIDTLSGLVESFGTVSLSFQSSLGTLTFPYTELAALQIVPVPPEPKPPKTPVTLDLVGGSVLSGDLISLDMTRARIDAIFQPGLEIPLEAITSLRFHGDSYSYLSDLDPVSVEEVPFVGSREDFRFPWQKDRSVSGRPLKVGDRLYSKGLGVHSKSRLEFDVKGYTRFEAKIGIVDEVLELLHQGSVVFRVLVDGEMRFESETLRGGEAAREIPSIPLEGGSRLVLEVDYGEDFDVADRAAWLEAIIIR